MKVKHAIDGKEFECHLFDGTNLGVEKVANNGKDAIPQFRDVKFWYYLNLTSPSGEKVRQDVKPGMLVLEDEEGNLTAMPPHFLGTEYVEVT